MTSALCLSEIIKYSVRNANECSVCKVAAAGCWLPCSTTNLTNIRKCILNARNYLSRTAIEAISIFEEFAFSSSFFSGKCARTEALGIHEHRNLSSSSTATTTTTTAFCFLYPSIRLFLFFCFGRLVGWCVCLRLCASVCLCLQRQRTGKLMLLRHHTFAGVGVETAAVLRAHTLPYSHPLFSRVKCMYTWSISTGFHRTHATYEAHTVHPMSVQGNNNRIESSKRGSANSTNRTKRVSAVVRFDLFYRSISLQLSHSRSCASLAWVRRLTVAALLSLSAILACSFSHMMRA